MRADGWSRMPLVRMTNLHLEPGEGSLDDLIADVDDGIYLETNRSWSIDDKRLNFQFGTQIAWEIATASSADVPRRDVHGDHAGVLGLARRRRGPRGVAAARADELRQGTAGPVRARVARRVARALPQRAGRSPRVSALEVAARALEHAAAAADEAEAFVHSERSGLARFAGSEQHQPTLLDDTVVTLRVVRDGRVGVAVTNRTSDDGASRARRARGRRGRARRAPIPTSPDCPARRAASVDGYDEETAALEPDEQARLAAAAIAAAGDLDAYGFFTSGVTELAVASTTGLEASQRLTDATVLVLASAEGRRATRRRPSSAVGASTRARARSRRRRRRRARAARASSSRARIARCSSRTRSRELLQYFAWDSLGGLGLLEERSYFTGRIGERVFDEKVTLLDDALDPRGLPKAFDFEGAPKQRVTLVEQGVARGVVWDRRTAKRAGGDVRGTGHAPPVGLEAYGPLAFALSLAGGDAESLDDLVAAVDDGIYITRLHYLGIVHPREGVITGHDARRHVPHPRRQDRRAARQPALHRRRAGRAADVPALTRTVTLVNQSDFYGERYPFGVLVPAIATARFHVTGIGSTPGL